MTTYTQNPDTLDTWIGGTVSYTNLSFSNLNPRGFQFINSNNVIITVGAGDTLNSCPLPFNIRFYATNSYTNVTISPGLYTFPPGADYASITSVESLKKYFTGIKTQCPATSCSYGAVIPNESFGTIEVSLRSDGLYITHCVTDITVKSNEAIFYTINFPLTAGCNVLPFNADSRFNVVRLSRGTPYALDALAESTGYGKFALNPTNSRWILTFSFMNMSRDTIASCSGIIDYFIDIPGCYAGCATMCVLSTIVLQTSPADMIAVKVVKL